MNRQLLIVVTFLLVFLLLSGCSANGSLMKKTTYASEGIELREYINSGEYVYTPANYALTNTVEIEEDVDATRINYEIYLSDPAVEMKDVIMSFHLNEKMMNYLYASHVHTSNVLNEYTFDIIPNGEPKGAYLSRSFVLAEDSIDRYLLSVYQDIYIKITYTLNGKRMEDFYRMEAVPTKETMQYIDKFMQ